MDVDVQRALAGALKAMAEASALFLRATPAGRRSTIKDDGTPVTETDIAIDQLLRSRLSVEFPNFAIRSEELGFTLGRDEWTWVIDPIDGTVGFLHGVPLASVLLALVHGADTVLAVIEFPELGWTFHAVSDGGAFLNGDRISVQSGFDLDHSIVCRGDRYTFELAGREGWYDGLNAAAKFCRSYTDAFGHCLVARGSAALVVDAAMEVWDHASVALVVAEAGGHVCRIPDLNDPARCGIVAGAPAAVEWALSLIGLSPLDSPG